MSKSHLKCKIMVLWMASSQDIDFSSLRSSIKQPVNSKKRATFMKLLRDGFILILFSLKRSGTINYTLHHHSSTIISATIRSNLIRCLLPTQRNSLKRSWLARPEKSEILALEKMSLTFVIFFLMVREKNSLIYFCHKSTLWSNASNFLGF